MTEQIRDNATTAVKAEPGLLAPRTSSTYKKLGKLFATGVIFQIAVLGFTAGGPAYTLASGTTLLLRTVPVDPWDIFRGNYVALRYDISTVSTAKSYDTGKTVFVVIKKASPYWTADYISESQPRLNRDEVAMKGKVAWVRDGKASIHYGIEQYFAPSEESQRLQSMHPDVQVAVDQFGGSVISKVIPKP